MHLEILLEERSAEAALRVLLPCIAPPLTYKTHVFGGKQDLLGKLPARLRAYSAWLPEGWVILDLIDNDADDCRMLKLRLDQVAAEVGLPTARDEGGLARVQFVSRIAVEELEAWFLGDVPALAAAYPGVSIHLGEQAAFRDPDRVLGGTWERLEAVLKNAGYYTRTGMPKIEVAERIASRMDPDRNRSQSFQLFRDTVRSLAGG